MENIKNVDNVLMLLGKTYKEKADGRKGGVGTETQVISNDVYKDVEQTKFIPIVIEKDKRGEAYLPNYLESRLYIDFSDNNLIRKNLLKLVREIHKWSRKEELIVLSNDKEIELNSLFKKNYS